MARKTILKALGLMSGTSLDGIDAAIIQSDGEEIIAFDAFRHHPYEAEWRRYLRQAIATPSRETRQVASDYITDEHLAIIKDILRDQSVDIIGFHGQTFLHQPSLGAQCRLATLKNWL